MGCLLGKQDINDIHPDIFSVHNIDHEVCLLFLHSKGGLTYSRLGDSDFAQFFEDGTKFENTFRN